MGNIARIAQNSSSTRTNTFQKRTSSTLVVREIVVARPLVKLQHVFKNKNSNANYTLHWSVVWSLWASGWSLWTVTRCACVRLRAWHLSVRPAGSLQTTCHRPSAASSPLFVFVFSFLFVFLFVFARSLQTPCHRPSAASSPLCWSIVIIRILLETPICWKLLLSLHHHLDSDLLKEWMLFTFKSSAPVKMEIL